jgi:hypothetical protein
MAQETYVDDSSLADGVSLWRRIPPWHLIYDSNRQGWRPSSAAFENDPDGGPMSVVVGDLVLAAGREPETVLAGHPGYGLRSFGVRSEQGTVVSRGC